MMLADRTSGEVCAELGVTRQTLMQIERRALEKMRALIGGTDDFPTLREGMLPALAKIIEQDKGRRTLQHAKWAREREVRRTR